jgi:hypothetical protein
MILIGIVVGIAVGIVVDGLEGSTSSSIGISWKQQLAKQSSASSATMLGHASFAFALAFAFAFAFVCGTRKGSR